MDESTLIVLEDPSLTYRCPGETYPISHAVHVARLAAYYPACRNCEHRHDTGVLSKRHVQQIERLEQRGAPGSLITDEGLAGVVGNQLTTQDSFRFAAAFGMSLVARRRLLEREPSVALAGDGRVLTAELVAASAEGLRSTGCRVTDLGGATAGLLTSAMRHLNTAGGLLVGNQQGEPHTASIKLWGHGARPWSTGGELDCVIQWYGRPFVRPTRQFGTLERLSCDEHYLEGLRPLYHGLRPLRLVLDTASRPLMGHFQQLLKTSACQIIALRICEKPKIRQQSRNSSSELSRGGPARMANLAEQVRADGVDFGAWIDGDGESLQLVDERGRIMPGKHFTAMLARHFGHDQHAAFLSTATRETTHSVLETTHAPVGGDPNGRYWMNDGAPQLDALLVLSLLLTILSQSDRPLSAVLDESDRSQ